MPDHAGDLCKWILGTDLNNLEVVTTASPKHDDYFDWRGVDMQIWICIQLKISRCVI